MDKNCICPESSIRIIQNAVRRKQHKESDSLVFLDLYRSGRESRVDHLDKPGEKVSLDSGNIIAFEYISALNQKSIK